MTEKHTTRLKDTGGSDTDKGTAQPSAALAGALDCAALGWYVAPIRIDHKAKCDGADSNCKDVRPLGSWKDSTNDPDAIRSWDWSECNAYGIDCEKSGIVVADQDPGSEWPFDSDRVHSTGRGFHFIYSAEDDLGLPLELKTDSKVQPWGIDTRAVGGIIFGPGSWHPHGRYEVLKDGEPGPPPAELVEALQRPSRTPVGVDEVYAGPAYADLPPDLQKRARAFQAKKVDNWSTRLEFSTAMDEHVTGAPNYRGEERGWEKLVRDTAWSLAMMAYTSWLPMTHEEAQETFEAILPMDYRNMEDDNLLKDVPWPSAVARKIEENGYAPPGLPPWEGEGSPPGVCKMEGCDEPIRWGRMGCEEHADEVEEELAVNEDGEKAGSSWKRQDVASALLRVKAGETGQILPTVCEMATGGCLLYPGRITVLFGESGSGKTWLALLAVKQEIEAGNHAVFIDFEDDLTSAVIRLLAIGADESAIVERFHYIAPEESLKKGTRRKLITTLDQIGPSLVVIDSTGESLALEGKNPNADEDVATWVRLLPKACTGCGAAVAVIDHIPKEGGANGPIGSQRKRAAAFAAYQVETEAPFAKGSAGRARVVANKDKAGNYRKGDVVALLRAEPGDGDESLTLTLDANGKQEKTWDDRLLTKICVALQTAYEESVDEEWPGASQNHVAGRVGGNATKIRTHLAHLVDLGHVDREKRGQTNYHTLQSMYVPSDAFGEETIGDA